MKRIKLDAIDSTNIFLKDLSNSQTLENFTVVTAEMQTNGRGQMGTQWVSEKGKNLIASVLIKDIFNEPADLFYLNAMIATTVLEALRFFDIPKMSIKWPNDIMSDTKKLAGILIENSLKKDGTIHSIVGFGLNVNQTYFNHLPKATSLKSITNQEWDKELLLSKIMEILEPVVLDFNTGSKESLWRKYETHLFKKESLMPFELRDGRQFMGIIQGVSKQGKLQLLLENDIKSEFEIKEIQMLY